MNLVMSHVPYTGFFFHASEFSISSTFSSIRCSIRCPSSDHQCHLAGSGPPALAPISLFRERLEVEFLRRRARSIAPDSIFANWRQKLASARALKV